MEALDSRSSCLNSNPGSWESYLTSEILSFPMYNEDNDRKSLVELLLSRVDPVGLGRSLTLCSSKSHGETLLLSLIWGVGMVSNNLNFK